MVLGCFHHPFASFDTSGISKSHFFQAFKEGAAASTTTAATAPPPPPEKKGGMDGSCRNDAAKPGFEISETLRCCGWDFTGRSSWVCSIRESIDGTHANSRLGWRQKLSWLCHDFFLRFSHIFLYFVPFCHAFPEFLGVFFFFLYIRKRPGRIPTMADASIPTTPCDAGTSRRRFANGRFFM